MGRLSGSSVRARPVGEQNSGERTPLLPPPAEGWNVAPAPVSGEKDGGSSVAGRGWGCLAARGGSTAARLRVVLLMGENARDGRKWSGLVLRGKCCSLRCAAFAAARAQHRRRPGEAAVRVPRDAG